MANCPNCGSSHIQLKKETNVSWGRAVAGWALFGVVGGAVGAVTGEDRNVNACLDCGTSWKATDLYKTLQIIKDLTGATLNLARERDRSYMNSFMHEIGSCLESMSGAEKESEKLLATINSKLFDKTATWGCYGCLTSIGGCFAVSSAISSGGLIWVLVVPPIVGFLIGAQLDKANKRNIEQEIERVETEAARMKSDAEERLRLKVAEFVENNPI